jgi:hypothetical protein
MTNNNWPDPARPGVPLNPERDGWHWLRTLDENDAPYEWRGSGECERGRWPAHWVLVDADDWQPAECTYLGPVLTAAEVEARVSEAMKWRTAIYDALIEWHDPPRDDETPKAALRRLVHTEILAALDPAVSRPAADLVTRAKREALEEAARLAKQTADVLSNPSAKDSLNYVVNAIRALKVEGDE